MKQNLRFLYLYLFAFVGLLVVVIGSIRLVDLGLKVLVFKGADRYEVYAPLKSELTGEQINEEEIKERNEREALRQRFRLVLVYNID